jgi:guanylate kinase
MPRSAQPSSSRRDKGDPGARRGRLVILSGPSCVGKTPLHKALGRFYPELNGRLHKLVLFNSRSPRPGEIDGKDYHFRTRAQIDELRSDNRYAVLEVRADLQALDIPELESLLQQGDVLFEGSSFVGRALQTNSRLASVNRLSIFISPLSKEEIAYLKAPERNVSLPDLLTDVMRRKLLRRTTRQKMHLSLKDLEDIEKRAVSAYRELQEGWHFDYVIANHDGEDSDNWDAFYYLIGDARKSLDAFAELLKGSTPANIEKWDENLLPESGSRD